MKQKLFAFFALLAMVMLPMIAWAEPTEVYSLTTTGELGTAGTDVDGETPYTKGGVVYAMNTLETNLWTAGASDEDPWTIKGVAQYIKVVVANNFQAGDQIVIKGKGNGSFRIFDNATGSTSADAYAFQQAMSKSTEAEYTLTVGANNPLIGKNTFYLRWSSGSNEGSLYYIKVNQDPTAETYNITIADGIANGTVEANATSARAGVEITLTAIPADGYELDAFSVKQGAEDVTVNGNKFIMPAGDVMVSATFKEEVIPANAIYYLKTTGDFGTDNGDGTFTKDGITYEKSSLNNTADTNHNPAWWRIANKTGYLGCILPSALQAGDQIVIAGRASSSSIKILLRTVNAVTVDDVATEFIEVPTGTTDETTFTYTVTAEDILAGQSKFYIMQSTTSSFYLKNVQVLSSGTVYNVSMADMTNGSVTATPANAIAGTTITLTVTPDEGYELDNIYAEPVTDEEGDTPIFGAPAKAPSFDLITLTKVDDNTYTFVMPANDVIVTATFKEKHEPEPEKRYLTVAKEWMAFCSPETFAVPDGLKVYTISAVTQPASAEEPGTVTLKQQNIIAEGVPMIIENTDLENTTKYEIVNAEGAIVAADVCAEFKGSATGALDLSTTSVNYVLKNGVFVRTTAKKAAQYSCFIEFTGANAAPYFSMTVDDDATTSIQSLETAVMDNGEWFTISGIRMAQPTQRGIYIHNGKKVVIK